MEFGGIHKQPSVNTFCSLQKDQSVEILINVSNNFDERSHVFHKWWIYFSTNPTICRRFSNVLKVRKRNSTWVTKSLMRCCFARSSTKIGLFTVW